MRTLILLFCALLPAWAANTTVAQTVLGADGQPANGRVSIQISDACKSGANYVGKKAITASIAAGAFSVSLVPNDSCVPAGTSYTATWQLTGGSGWVETWVVPTSVTPVTVDSVVTSPAPTASYVIQWTQMGQNGAVLGDAPLWNGSVWLPGVPSGGVPSVFGRSGAVVAASGDYNTSQVTENPADLYFTQARAIAALAGLYQTPITGAPSTWPSFATVATSGSYTDLANKPTTTQITEGSNLYYTNARAIAALAGLYQTPITGAPSTWPSFATVATSGSYTDLSNKPSIPSTTSQISEGSNLYFTNARAISALAGLYQTPITGAPGTWPSFATVATSGSYTDLSNKPTIPTNTGQITESGNLYFTNARAQASLYTGPQTGAVAEAQSAKNAQLVSVKDFGAACDNSTDDSTAFQTAVNSVADGTTAQFRIPDNSTCIVNTAPSMSVRQIGWGVPPGSAIGGSAVMTGTIGIPGGATSSNTLRLAHFLGNLNNTAINVALIGDSETQGYYATNRITQSWAGLVTSTLQASYGNRGTGLIPVYNTNYAWAAAGSWTASTTIGPYQSAISSSVFSATGTGSAYSATVAYSLNNLLADSFTVLTYTASDSGNCAVSIDGQPATVLTHASSGTATPVADTVSAGGYGYHSIAVGPNGSTQKCYFFGVVPTVGTSGLIVHNLGLSGTATSFFGSTTGTAGGLGFLSLLSPDLVIVSIGINDYNTGVSVSTFTNYYTAILNAVQATGASLVILGEPPNSTSDSGGSAWPSYRAAIQTLANTYGAVFLDVNTRWPTYAYANARGFIFTNHPSTAGHADIANYVISSLFPLAATQSQAPSPASSSPGVAVATPVVFAPSTDLVCAYGGDVTIGKKAVSAATIAANAVLTVAATTDYTIGSLVTLSGFADSGWNGNYTVTASPSATQITVSLASTGLTFTGAGTPIIALTCTNSADSNATTQQSFRTTYRIAANSFSQRGKRLRFDAVFKLWSTANVSSTLPCPRFKVGAATPYLPVGCFATNISGSQSGQSLPAHFGLTLLGPSSSSAPLLSEGFWPLPGWTFVHTENGNPSYQLFDTTSPLVASLAMGYATSGVGGTVTYVSGGTATGTGNCLATANGTTVPASDFTAIGLIGVSGGTISGTLSIGPTFPQTNSGVAYTAVPTTWGLSLPSAGAASTCSGTITTSGGTIVGAMGNAMQLVMLAPTWIN